MPYTVHDTPDVADRIEDDLDEIVSTVRDADPALRSIVLTGGFARGEGAVFHGQPQNDYDLVAVRGLGRPVDYDRLTVELEQSLQIHVDLAPISALRLPFVSSSIFWYETALRGQILWGEDLLDRIAIQSAAEIDPTEGMRLLVNRSAGLLLAHREHAHARRIQAAKGLLAALDAHLLAEGTFAPSQRERWERYQELREADRVPGELERLDRWISWAYEFKTQPESATKAEAATACHAAADAITEAIPVALQHAGLASLEAYERQDGIVDHLYYALNASQVPGGRRFLWNPTGQVRSATVRLLEALRDGALDRYEVHRQLSDLADVGDEPMAALEALREATLQ